MLRRQDDGPSWKPWLRNSAAKNLKPAKNVDIANADRKAIVLFVRIMIGDKADMCTLRDLPVVITVSEVKARLELLSGLPSSVMDVQTVHGKRYEDNDVLLRGKNASFSDTIRVNMNSAWNSLFQAAWKGSFPNIQRQINSLKRHDPLTNTFSVSDVTATIKTSKNGGERALDEALFIASRRGSEKICRFLLKNGASTTYMTFFGNSSLHVAACAGHLPIVQLLMAHEANVRWRNVRGKSPLEIAVDRGHFDCARWLWLNQWSLAITKDMVNQNDQKPTQDKGNHLPKQYLSKIPVSNLDYSSSSEMKERKYLSPERGTTLPQTSILRTRPHTAYNIRHPPDRSSSSTLTTHRVPSSASTPRETSEKQPFARRKVTSNGLQSDKSKQIINFLTSRRNRQQSIPPKNAQITGLVMNSDGTATQSTIQEKAVKSNDEGTRSEENQLIPSTRQIEKQSAATPNPIQPSYLKSDRVLSNEQKQTNTQSLTTSQASRPTLTNSGPSEKMNARNLDSPLQHSECSAFAIVEQRRAFAHESDYWANRYENIYGQYFQISGRESPDLQSDATQRKSVQERLTESSQSATPRDDRSVKSPPYADSRKQKLTSTPPTVNVEASSKVTTLPNKYRYHVTVPGVEPPVLKDIKNHKIAQETLRDDRKPSEKNLSEATLQVEPNKDDENKSSTDHRARSANASKLSVQISEHTLPRCDSASTASDKRISDVQRQHISNKRPSTGLSHVLPSLQNSASDKSKEDNLKEELGEKNRKAFETWLHKKRKVMAKRREEEAENLAKLEKKQSLFHKTSASMTFEEWLRTKEEGGQLLALGEETKAVEKSRKKEIKYQKTYEQWLREKEGATRSAMEMRKFHEMTQKQKEEEKSENRKKEYEIKMDAWKKKKEEMKRDELERRKRMDQMALENAALMYKEWLSKPQVISFDEWKDNKEQESRLNVVSKAQQEHIDQQEREMEEMRQHIAREKFELWVWKKHFTKLKEAELQLENVRKKRKSRKQMTASDMDEHVGE